MTDRPRPTDATAPFDYPGDVGELLRWARAADVATRCVISDIRGRLDAQQAPPAAPARPQGPTGPTASDPVGDRPAKLVAD